MNKKSTMVMAAVALTLGILPATANDVPLNLPKPDGQPGNSKQKVKVFILASDENCLEQAVVAGRSDGKDVQLFLNATPTKDEVAGVVQCEVFKDATSAVTGVVALGEDRIDVPAIGHGLHFHSLIHLNMVLQRDKPVSLWGWATAGADRSWKVTFPAMPARSEPVMLTVKEIEKTLTLENILISDVWWFGGLSKWSFPSRNLKRRA